MSDTRYSIRREYGGHATARYVVRFCGVYIGNATNRRGAIRLARRHDRARQAILTGQA